MAWEACADCGGSGRKWAERWAKENRRQTTMGARLRNKGRREEENAPDNTHPASHVDERRRRLQINYTCSWVIAPL
jgi:hypothetical protein